MYKKNKGNTPSSSCINGGSAWEAASRNTLARGVRKHLSASTDMKANVLSSGRVSGDPDGGPGGGGHNVRDVPSLSKLSHRMRRVNVSKLIST